MVTTTIYQNEKYLISSKFYETGFTLTVNQTEKGEIKRTHQIDIQVDLNNTEINHNDSYNLLIDGLEEFLIENGEAFAKKLDNMPLGDSEFNNFPCDGAECHSCTSE